MEPDKKPQRRRTGKSIEGPVKRKGLKSGRFLDVRGVRPQAMKEGEILGVSLRRTDLVNAMHKGLPVGSVESLRARLNVTQETLISHIHMSNGTLARRRESGQLTTQESERVYRYAHLLNLATEMMLGDEANAIAWLKSQKDILGGVTPLEYAETEVGARAVEDYIHRVMDGTYS